MLSARERHAEDAIKQFIQKSCAFLLPGNDGQRAEEIGSGVIIETKNKHYIVLTARHIAEDARRNELRLGYFLCENPISDFVSGIMYHNDEDIDVAILIIKKSLVSLVKPNAISSSSVPAEKAKIQEQNRIVLIGYPAQMSSLNERTKEQGFRSITYWCGPPSIEPSSKGKLCLEWKNAQMDGKDYALPPPNGMSGGPLWLFQKPAASCFWSADKIGKIIGIQSGWDRRENLIIEPVQRWCDWFHQSLDIVDQDTF